MSSTFFDFFHIFLICILHSILCFIDYCFLALNKTEKEGFEPPRLLHPVGFQDQSLQPDLGISPYNFYQNMVDLLGLEPRTDRL